MIIPVVVLLVVFILIAVRQVGSLKLQIWQIMLVGAIVVLVTGQISPVNALMSINVDVILFLFGMFIVGEALLESGYLSYLSFRFFKNVKSADRLLLAVLFGFGLLSAFLMNDTVAIIGVPVVLLLARQCRIPPKLMLLTLAFSVTIGSVMSPIGNPQNILVAINGNISNPFIVFFSHLFLPTMLNLFLAFFLLRFFFRKELKTCTIAISEEPIRDSRLAFVSKVSLVLMIGLVFAKIVTVLLGIQVDFKLTYIALAPAVLVLVLSRRRIELVRKIDWRTLVFFVAMFVLMESVWDSGFFQSVMVGLNLNVMSVVAILLVSVLLSQFISNVPLVALYLPLLVAAGVGSAELMALVSGSTIAGNLFILGAASNVIIIQNAENKFGETITFLEFGKIGAILTAVNLAVYWLFLSLGS